jgi:acetyltransferase-like isoleucine patch superfamily enzyme
MARESVRIHPTAYVHDEATIGDHTMIWQFAQVRAGAVIGQNCIIGQGCYIEGETTVGSNVKMQTGVFLCDGVTLEDGVFAGPHACFTNDLAPRSIRPDGVLKGPDDWVLTKTLVKYGASLGANSTIVCGITVGRWALVAAGSVVTRDVPDYGLVMGNPARLRGFVGPSCEKAQVQELGAEQVTMVCPQSQEQFVIPRAVYDLLLS